MNWILADDHVIHGAYYYFSTSLIVVVGGMFGLTVVSRCNEHPTSREAGDSIRAFSAWDGVCYRDIADHGYSINAGGMSNVAFFPAYPALGAALAKVAGLQSDLALLIISHFALLVSFALFHCYVRTRFPTDDGALAANTLLCFGVIPTTFFFRMAYSESLFLLAALLAMLGIRRQWPLLVVAIVIGFACATRVVGVALVVPLIVALWNRSTSMRGFVGSLCLLLPLSVWGLAAYMCYLYWQFGDPFVFAKVQGAWSERHLCVKGYLWSLASGDVIWSVYNSDSVCYWAKFPPRNIWLFNLRFWNPIYWLCALVVLFIGRRMRVLDLDECLLSVGLLGIPFFVQGARACMAAEARYVACAFPLYIVCAMLYMRVSPSLRAPLVALSSLLLGMYSALFCTWYWFY